MTFVQDVTTKNAPQAIAAIVNAVTQCKFEATDAVTDEIVLLQILSVLRTALQSGLGALLTDEMICCIMETGFSMCFQMRFSGAEIDFL